MNERTRCIYNELDRMGIKHPSWTIQLARDNDVSISLFASILMQESGGGRNVFGHDPVNPRSATVWDRRRVRWLNMNKGRKVTRYRYLRYRRYRKMGYGMQGVGPMQLTWYTFQDDADKLGGAWRPYNNMKIGIKLLSRYLHQTNLSRHQAIAHYNGSGLAADRYADQVLRRADDIHDRLKHCV
jgi:hypothetical protein